MDTQVVALLGTALSALVAALAYYGKARHERLRTTRTVLYYLLEMRYHFAVAEYGVSQLLEQYLEMIASTLKTNGVVLQDSEREALNPVLKHLFREVSAARVEELGKQIVEPYLRALAELARDDPVLAYRLRGREILTRASTAIAEYVRIAGLHEIPPDDVQIKDALLTDIDDLDRQLTLDMLADASRQVAFHCGPFLYVQTHLVIRKQNRVSLSSNFGTGVNVVLDNFVKRVIENESQKLLQAKMSTVPTTPTQHTTENET